MTVPRAMARIVARPAVSRWALRLATALDRPLMRATRGRLRLSFIIPVLLLRCRGAKSGELREVPLLYAPDGDNAVVVASNGGQSRLPAWAHNLRSNPRVECVLKGNVGPFLATELSGAARDRAWSLAVEVYPGYDIYAARTAHQIPLFELRPVTSDQRRVPS